MTIKDNGICLKKPYKNERKNERKGLTHLYVTNANLYQYQLHYDNNGTFITDDLEFPDGLYLYVRTLDGKIYAVKITSNDQLVNHHSYLSNGKKVLSAGYFVFEKGKLILVSNESGHYTPTNEEMLPDINFYYQIAKNEELIYEDHSLYPEMKIIYQFKAKDLQGKNSIIGTPIYNCLWGKKSDYGIKHTDDNHTDLNNTPSKQQADTPFYKNECALPLFNKASSHYLPDEQLLIVPQDEDNNTPVTQDKNEYFLPDFMLLKRSLL